jgi:hypothetical protein
VSGKCDTATPSERPEGISYDKIAPTPSPHTHTRIHSQSYICIHTHTQTYTHTYTHTHIHTYTHTHIHTYTHTHIHTYIHTYTHTKLLWSNKECVFIYHHACGVKLTLDTVLTHYLMCHRVHCPHWSWTLATRTHEHEWMSAVIKQPHGLQLSKWNAMYLWRVRVY